MHIPPYTTDILHKRFIIHESSNYDVFAQIIEEGKTTKISKYQHSYQDMDNQICKIIPRKLQLPVWTSPEQITPILG